MGTRAKAYPPTHHRNGRLSIRAGLILLALLLVSVSGAPARELIPFPSQQQRSFAWPAQQAAPRPAPQPDYLSNFEQSIADMDCGQLQAVRNRLASNQQSASLPADREYFAQLIRLLDRRRDKLGCPP